MGRTFSLQKVCLLALLVRDLDEVKAGWLGSQVTTYNLLQQRYKVTTSNFPVPRHFQKLESSFNLPATGLF